MPLEATPISIPENSNLNSNTRMPPKHEGFRENKNHDPKERIRSRLRTDTPLQKAIAESMERTLRTTGHQPSPPVNPGLATQAAPPNSSPSQEDLFADESNEKSPLCVDVATVFKRCSGSDIPKSIRRFAVYLPPFFSVEKWSAEFRAFILERTTEKLHSYEWVEDTCLVLLPGIHTRWDSGRAARAVSLLAVMCSIQEFLASTLTGGKALSSMPGLNEEIKRAVEEINKVVTAPVVKKSHHKKKPVVPEVVTLPLPFDPPVEQLAARPLPFEPPVEQLDARTFLPEDEDDDEDEDGAKGLVEDESEE